MKKLYRGPYIDAFCQVWFNLVQLFQRSRLKYEKLTDGRRTDDGRQVMAIPHMTLWVRWAKNKRNVILGEKFKNMPKNTKNWEKLSWIIYVFENHLKWDRKISLWAVVISKRLWLKRFKICETLCVGRKSNWPKKEDTSKDMFMTFLLTSL
jgi:hypothetical protein